jgi:hypothetical protein
MNERRPTTDPASPTIARAERARDNRAPEGEETTAPAETPGGASDRSAMETTDYSASASDVIASRSPTRRYTVLGRVAQGGMGVIFKVWDGSLHRPLAMKVIRRIGDMANNPSTIRCPTKTAIPSQSPPPPTAPSSPSRCLRRQSTPVPRRLEVFLGHRVASAGLDQLCECRVFVATAAVAIASNGRR